MPRKRVSPKMARTAIQLPEKQIAALEKLVGRGEFKDKSEAARAAVGGLLEKRAKRLLKK